LPSDDTYAVEYASPADGSGRLVVLVYDHNRDRTRDRERVRVRPAGLVPTTRYSLRGTDLVVSGQSAATLGVVVPFALAVDADILVFDPVT
jgi:alpha-galactosidase